SARSGTPRGCCPESRCAGGGSPTISPGWPSTWPARGRATTLATLSSSTAATPFSDPASGYHKEKQMPATINVAERLPNRLVIGADFLDHASGGQYEHVNPATGHGQRVLPMAGPEEVDRAVAAARSALA